MIEEPKFYQSKKSLLTGTNYRELLGKARTVFREIEVLTGNRTTYVRSAYFRERKTKQKIFLKPFWNHLYDKAPDVRKRRLSYYDASIDLLKNSCVPPTARGRDDVILYRFYGITKDKARFAVQVKLEKGALYHMSTFPWRG